LDETCIDLALFATGTHAKAGEPVLQDWDLQTYNYWVNTLERERLDPKLPKAGLKVNSHHGHHMLNRFSLTCR